MGRPLNDRYFGDPLETSGPQLMISEAHIPGASGPTTGAWIVRQRAVGRFEVTDGVDTGIVKLINGPGPISEGEALVECAVYGTSDVEYARTIHAHQVKTHEGNVYRWFPTGARASGDADLPLM